MHARSRLADIFLAAASRLGVGLVVLLLSVGAAQAQGQSVTAIAPQNLGLAINQANLRNLSMLPPVTNPGFSYEFDPQLGVFVSRRNFLGSGIIDAARFEKKGSLQLGYAFGYYQLNELNGEDVAAIVVTQQNAGDPPRTTIGAATRAEADVYASRFAARYTLLDRLSIGLEIPLLVVDVSSQFFSQELTSNAQKNSFLGQGLPPSGDYNRPGTLFNGQVNQFLPFNQSPNSFNEGTNVDIGNISLDTKVGFSLGVPNLSTGFLAAVRLPTGSESRFSGTDSTGLRGLFLADLQVEDFAIYFEGGYEHDFSFNQLSNGILGLSGVYRPAPMGIVEVGMRANLYEQDISLYPTRQFNNATVVDGSSSIGRSQANVLVGGRLSPLDALVLSTYLSLPVTDAGFTYDVGVFFAVDYVL